MHWENHLDFYLIFFLHIFKYYGKFKIYVGKVINLSKYFSENFVWICNRLKNMLLASLKLGIFTSLWKKIEMVFLGWNSAKMEFGVYILIWIWKIDFYLILKSPPSNLKATVLCIWGLWGRFFKTALFKKLMINTIFRWHHQVSIPCRYCTFSYFVQIKQILNMMSKELSGLQSVVMVN